MAAGMSQANGSALGRANQDERVTLMGSGIEIRRAGRPVVQLHTRPVPAPGYARPVPAPAQPLTSEEVEWWWPCVVTPVSLAVSMAICIGITALL